MDWQIYFGRRTDSRHLIRDRLDCKSAQRTGQAERRNEKLEHFAQKTKPPQLNQTEPIPAGHQLESLDDEAAENITSVGWVWWKI